MTFSDAAVQQQNDVTTGVVASEQVDDFLAQSEFCEVAIALLELLEGECAAVAHDKSHS